MQATVSRGLASRSVIYLLYLLAFATAIYIWLRPVRAGLSLDETGSYWLISAGLSHIWSRGFVSLAFPVYSYILWLSTKIFGTSEAALRIPSLLAMFGAVYLLYLAAREFFEWDAAIFAVLTFCIDPIVAYASIDARPYAFGVLAVNAAILVLLRLRHSDSNWLAAVLGLLAASVVYFNYLFATILPAFAVCFFLIKGGDRKIAWRQFGIAVVMLALAFIPLVPGIEYLFHTKGSHVYEQAPEFKDLVQTLMPWIRRPVFVSLAIVLALMGTIKAQGALLSRSRLRTDRLQLLFCALLALVPLLTLYGVSAETPIHTFASRHRLIAVPGIALCWGFLINHFPRRIYRLLFCIAAVASTAYYIVPTPDAEQHLVSQKYALIAAEKNASADDAPVVVCSGFIESSFATMPQESPKDSPYFAPLSYYKLTVPVVPLPRDLNSETIRVGAPFLQQAQLKHQRFLMIGEKQSYPTLDWFTQQASGDDVHTLGIFEGVKVLEFVPKAQAKSSDQKKSAI